LGQLRFGFPVKLIDEKKIYNLQEYKKILTFRMHAAEPF